MVEHMQRNRLTTMFLAVYLMLALGLAGAHSHGEHEDTESLSHKCVACMVVSDLDDADIPSGSSISDAGPKLTVLPQASHELTPSDTVDVKARGPPAHL